MLHIEGNTYQNGKKSQVNIIVKNDNQMQDSGENTQKNWGEKMTTGRKRRIKVGEPDYLSVIDIWIHLYFPIQRAEKCAKRGCTGRGGKFRTKSARFDWSKNSVEYRVSFVLLCLSSFGNFCGVPSLWQKILWLGFLKSSLSLLSIIISLFAYNCSFVHIAILPYCVRLLGWAFNPLKGDQRAHFSTSKQDNQRWNWIFKVFRSANV